MRSLRLPIVACGLMLTGGLIAAPWATPADGDSNSAPRVDYFRDVRPILSQHCYECHGPDEAKREAGLRLDRKDGALADLDGARAVTPFDAATSMLVERIFDDIDPMPPERFDDPLSAAQKDTLRRWIEEGAQWPEHWAFRTPTRPSVPAATDPSWVRDPIDAFVLKRLDEAGLPPALEASREGWLRRVSFDLTGLPPTIAELDAFLGDQSDKAYEKQVDRLLDSPRYGERQAQEWLDVARYADTSGHQFDTPRKMWRWRDWVISAFNKNLPFDQFTIEQLAGDLLPNPTVDQLVATGFNRNNPTDDDGPSELDEYRTAYVLDRVHTTATAFMGLTMACVQCHDHKFDPLTQEDYYSFFAFFNNVAERDIDYGNARPRMRVPNADQAAMVDDLRSRIAELKEELKADNPILDRAQRVWEEETLARAGGDVSWTNLEPVGMIARNGSWLRALEDGSILATGPTPTVDTYELVIQPGARTIHALRLEVLPHQDNPHGRVGRGVEGGFHLSRIEVTESSLNAGAEPPLVYMATAQADLNQARTDAEDENEAQPNPVESAIAYPVDPDAPPEGNNGFRRGGIGWALVGDALGEEHEVVLVPLEPLQLNSASILRIRLVQSSEARMKNLVGRFRWSATDDPKIRETLVPMAKKLWSTVGPFPAASADEAFKTAFEPEADMESGFDSRKKYVQPVVAKVDEGSDDKKSADKKDEKDEQGTGEEPIAAETALAPGPADLAGLPTAAPVSPTDEPKSAEKNPADRRVEARIADKLVADKKVAAKKDDKVAAKKDDKAAAKKDDKVAVKKDDDKRAADKVGDAAAASKKPPRKVELTWKERLSWKDGARQSLEAGTAAWYLTRKVVTNVPRTAELSLDGPKGARVWLNGVEVFNEPPKSEPKDPEPEKDDQDRDDDQDDDDFDAVSGFRRAAGSTARKIRLGFRAGENVLVVKAVYAEEASGAKRGAMGGRGRRGNGGAPITLDLSPEGRDLVTHEVVTALRAGDPRGLGAATPAEAPSPLGSKGGPNAETDLEIPAAPALAMVDTVKLPAEESASAARRAMLRAYFRTQISTVGRALQSELSRLEEELRDYERKLPDTMVMSDRESKRMTHVFLRGDFRQKGAEVSERTPAILPEMAPDLPRNRLGLAKWLVSPEHPLTARVTVNRIWQQYFGTGLVETSDDFGIRSEPPSHPELLDWLAVEFREGGWDMKALHRRIVLSSTYRQSSASTARKQQIDPENRLLSRGPRVRLSAEMVRDNALAISGLLVEEVGGPSVKPYQAPGVWEEVGGGDSYKQDKGAAQYRRGIYVYWKRRVPYPSMVAFDAQSRETCTVRRPETNTPLQALVLLNNPVYLEAAKMLAARMLKEEALDDAERLAYGFRLCTSRAPSEAERNVLGDLLSVQTAAYSADAEGAKKLLSIGDAKVDEKLDVATAAAWTAVANALLNLDATIHRG